MGQCTIISEQQSIEANTMVQSIEEKQKMIKQWNEGNFEPPYSFESIKAKKSLNTPQSSKKQTDFLPYISSDKMRIYNSLPLWVKHAISQINIYSPPEFFSNAGCQFCCKILEDGSLYEGFMLNNKKHGYGMHCKEEEFYEGYFNKDEREGWGRCIYNNNEIQFGKWQNDKLTSEIQKKTLRFELDYSR